MKRLILIFAALGINAFIYAQKVNVKGNIYGLNVNSVQLVYIQGSEVHEDSIKVIDGNFDWSGQINEPIMAMLNLPDNNFSFYIEPGTISIELKADSIIVSGSKSDAKWRAMRGQLKEVKQQIDMVEKSMLLATGKEVQNNQQEIRRLDSVYVGIENDFIKANPDNVISIELVSAKADWRDYDEAVMAFNLLTKNVQQSEQGKMIASRLEVAEKSRVGAVLPEFIQNDPDGNQVKLTGFKGNFLFIDFWASTCVPCRAEIPNLLKAYRNYKDKGFSILGISLDESSRDWKKAIKDDETPWIQISDLKGTKNEIANYFGFTGIPRNLLVDPNGKIIAKDLHGDDLNIKLDELLGSK